MTLCPDCGHPVDQAQWTIATRTGYQTETRKFDSDSRGTGRYSLVPKSEGVPYARRVMTFDGTHNLHVCSALRDQGITYPTGTWVELSEDEMADEIRERMHWSMTPDPAEMGY